MSEHKATVRWRRDGESFEYDAYDRSHEVRFEGGEACVGSAAPAYQGRAEHVNPEELLAASLASCHMLTFLAVAAKSRLTVDAYADEATATLGKNDAGRMAVTKVVLRPRVTFAAEAPAAERLEALHAKAHRACMIANSVACAVEVAPPVA